MAEHKDCEYWVEDPTFNEPYNCGYCKFPLPRWLVTMLGGEEKITANRTGGRSDVCGDCPVASELN